MGASLFSNNILELTVDQLHFLSYCSFYKSLSELPEDERPSDDVIEDDSKLEAWTKERFLKRKKENMMSQSNNNRSTEVFRL